MLAWYIIWPVFSIALVLVIDRLVYSNWYWQWKGNLWYLWKAAIRERI